jgi:N-acetylneuraminic acid mutarotase
MSERPTLIKKALSLSLMSLTALTSTVAAGWEDLPPLPVPNGGGVCGAVGSRIVMIGGTHWEGGSKQWLRSIYEYDPASRVWRKDRDLPGPIAYSADLETPSGLAFIGGSDGTKPIKAIVVMAGAQPKWEPIPELPTSLVLPASGAIGSKYVIVGGTDDATNLAGVQRTTHVVEQVDGRWKVTRLADYPGQPFAIAASAVVGEELFVFGGANWDAARKDVANAREAFAFSLAKNSWRPLPPLRAPTRGLSAVALDDHRLYVAGGYTEVFTAAAWIYDTRAERYSPATPLPVAGMVSLVKCGDYLYSVAGEDKIKGRTDRCFRIPLADVAPSSRR